MVSVTASRARVSRVVHGTITRVSLPVPTWVRDAAIMGRIAGWVVVANLVVGGPAVADTSVSASAAPAAQPSAPSPDASPLPLPAAAPPLQPADRASPPPPEATGPSKPCRSNLYLEPSLLFGGSSQGGVGRLHAAVGFRYSHCPTPTGPDGFRVMLGGFAQVGSEQIGDAFTKGIETEFNMPVGVRRARLGGRAYYGTANHGLYMIGGGVRYRPGPVHFGFEMIYSSRSSEGQPA